MTALKLAATEHASSRGSFEIRKSESAEDWTSVLRLRELAYVKEQGRVARPEEVETIFGRHDRFSTHFLAYRNGVPIGTIRVTEDSELGLPCEGGVDLTVLRTGTNKLVEVGNWITVPELRAKGVGVVLVRKALLYSAALGATHILADFFLDAHACEKMKFYRAAGFRPLCEIYYDTRFDGSPESMVAVLPIGEVLRRQERDRAVWASRGTTVS